MSVLYDIISPPHGGLFTMISEHFTTFVGFIGLARVLFARPLGRFLTLVLMSLDVNNNFFVEVCCHRFSD
jgi:hypothetical protein